MLTLQQIKENPERVVERLAVKGFDGKELIARLLELDAERRQLQYKADNLAADLKKHADSIGRLMKEGKRDEAEAAKATVAALKGEQKTLADGVADAEKESTDILLTIPNLPCDAVPQGKTAADNVVEKTGGPMPELPEDALPHWDLAR